VERRKNNFIILGNFLKLPKLAIKTFFHQSLVPLSEIDELDIHLADEEEEPFQEQDPLQLPDQADQHMESIQTPTPPTSSPPIPRELIQMVDSLRNLLPNIKEEPVDEIRKVLINIRIGYRRHPTRLCKEDFEIPRTMTGMMIELKNGSSDLHNYSLLNNICGQAEKMLRKDFIFENVVQAPIRAKLTSRLIWYQDKKPYTVQVPNDQDKVIPKGFITNSKDYKLFPESLAPLERFQTNSIYTWAHNYVMLFYLEVTPYPVEASLPNHIQMKVDLADQILALANQTDPATAMGNAFAHIQASGQAVSNLPLTHQQALISLQNIKDMEQEPISKTALPSGTLQGPPKRKNMSPLNASPKQGKQECQKKQKTDLYSNPTAGPSRSWRRTTSSSTNESTMDLRNNLKPKKKGNGKNKGKNKGNKSNAETKTWFNPFQGNRPFGPLEEMFKQYCLTQSFNQKGRGRSGR